jgi:hypothetical protein
MAQTTSFVNANAPAATVRARMNEISAALVSSNSGATAPTTTVAGMLWDDTSITPSVLKKRNVTNDGWITMVPAADPTLTGTVTIPTPTEGDNTTKAASTAFVTTHAMPKVTTSGGIGNLQTISPAAGTAYTVPAGGTWFVSAQQIGTGGAATLVQSRNVVAGGTSLATPGAGYAWTGFAWKVS